MKKTYLIDKKFKHHPIRYFYQSLLAFVCIFIILSVLDVVTHSAIVASLGASCFIAFTMPQHRLSKSKNLIGGYCIGIICGVFFKILIVKGYCVILNVILLHALYGALACAISMFFMVIGDMEHAPACGISLGLVFNTWTGSTLLVIITAISMLSFIKYLLKPYMFDLI